MKNMIEIQRVETTEKQLNFHYTEQGVKLTLSLGISDGKVNLAIPSFRDPLAMFTTPVDASLLSNRFNFLFTHLEGKPIGVPEYNRSLAEYLLSVGDPMKSVAHLNLGACTEIVCYPRSLCASVEDILAKASCTAQVRVTIEHFDIELMKHRQQNPLSTIGFVCKKVTDDLFILFYREALARRDACLIFTDQDTVPYQYFFEQEIKKLSEETTLGEFFVQPTDKRLYLDFKANRWYQEDAVRTLYPEDMYFRVPDEDHYIVLDTQFESISRELADYLLTQPKEVKYYVLEPSNGNLITALYKNSFIVFERQGHYHLLKVHSRPETFCQPKQIDLRYNGYALNDGCDREIMLYRDHR